jgi:hypothetical protein
VAQARTLYWQNKCLSYAPPADAIAFDRSKAAAGYTMPRCWAELRNREGWAPWPHTVVFMHERRTPGGQPRLVVVTLGAYPVGWGNALFVAAAKPATLATPVAFGRPWKWPILDLPGLFDRSVTPFLVYVGQPDANDPTHFTIPFTSKGTPGIIDGWLADDDSVTLVVRR